MLGVCFPTAVIYTTITIIIIIIIIINHTRTQLENKQTAVNALVAGVWMRYPIMHLDITHNAPARYFNDVTVFSRYYMTNDTEESPTLENEWP